MERAGSKGERKRKLPALAEGDFVVGMHADPAGSYTTVAGKIDKITCNKSGEVIYHVSGNILIRPGADPIELSGVLQESEIEVIDPGTYRRIIELFDLATKQLIAEAESPYPKQIIASSSYKETVQKIRDLRHKSRQELEEKYPAAEV